MFGTDLSLWVFVTACVAAAMTGAFFRPGDWYYQLSKPNWTPPDWVFPVVWTALYAMIAVAGWWVWRAAAPGDAWVPIGLWAVQLIANAAWSPVFFGLRRPAWGMVVVSVMWVSIAATIWAFAGVSTWAAWFMAPYLLWVTIAATLNYAILQRNPADRGWAVSWAR